VAIIRAWQSADWRTGRQQVLPQVRCPQCGATSDTRNPGYPFCAGCQDNLAKCGYCRWFDDRLGACTSLVRSAFEISATATPPCGQHSPRPSLQVRRDGRLAPMIAIGLAAAVFVLGYGLVRLRQPALPPPAPEGALQLTVEAEYGGAAMGHPYAVTVEIRNVSDSIVKGVRFGIDREFLQRFAIRKATPQPLRQEESGKWEVLHYPDLNSHERRTITLELLPKAVGDAHLRVQVASDAGASHGIADLPITVTGCPRSMGRGPAGRPTEAGRGKQ